MPQLMARSAVMCFAVLLVLLAAVSPASSVCTLNVQRSGTVTDANGIFVLNEKAYIASATGSGHLIVVPLSSMVIENNWAVTNPAFDVFVSESTAYMTEGSSGVQVVNAATGGALGLCTNWDPNLFAIGIYISGSYAYVGATDYSNGKLVVLSLSNPNSPSVVSTISSGPMASGGGGLCVADGKIYLATDNGVDVFSISTPANPTFVETISIAGGTYDVHVFGNDAYVVQGSNVAPGLPNVKVLDLSNPGTPTNCYIDSAPPYAIQFYGGKIYIVDPNGLKELSLGSGSLTVTLDAVPNDAQDFSFSGTDLGSFILDDDSDSTYSNTTTFSNMAAGDYIFQQIVPSGWLLSSITATDPTKVTYSSDGGVSNAWHTPRTAADTWVKASVQAGSSLTVNFQDTRVYSISGHVIYDLNGDGIRNNFENFVADGWKLELWKDGTKTTDTTTLSGAYSFNNLAPGNYEVRSASPDGWVNTTPVNGRRTYSSLSTDQTNQDFGARGSLSISGHVIYDLDGSGTRNNLESFVSNGWKLELYKDGTKIAENTTYNGAYAFNSLAPGSYEVRSVLLAGWVNTLPANGRRTYSSLTAVQTDQDFGARGSLSISGSVIYDLDGNGVRNNFEGFVTDGWILELYENGTKTTQTTTSGGAYSFDNLAPGSYEVRSILPMAYWNNTLPANGRRTYSSLTTVQTNQDFGVRGSLSISGSVIYDLDGNGVRNNLEGFVADGWKLELYKDGTKIAENTTLSGAYAFKNLANGSYEVRSVLLAGWANTLPLNGRRTYSSLTTVQTDQDFGARGSLSISGHVIYDLDGSGTRNNLEIFVADGWKLELYKDGTKIAENAILSGAYAFNNLATGSYEVRSVLLAGWANTQPVNGRRTYSSLTTVQTDQDFGVRGSLSISGSVIYDLDGNGVQNNLEGFVADGWMLELYKDGTKIAENTTQSGDYAFNNLVTGSYEVRSVLLAGWVNTLPADGIRTYSSLTTVQTNQDFGSRGNLSIAGIKFHDLNGDGTKDTGEPGLDGWTIDLKKDGAEIASVKTDANGAYSFSDIAPGNYIVEEAVNSSWTQSYPASPGTQNVTLVSGVAGPNDVDFGNWRSTGFSGMKFEDLNSNSARDSGEPGLAGWTIRLMKGSTEVASTVTSAGGAYSFSGIAPGNYTVEEVVNSSWTQSYPASPGTQNVTLVSGFAGPTDVNFGNWRSTGFSGMKFEDLNSNGARDSGEPGLAGWTIKVKQGGTEVASTVTAASGAYSFSGIAPGNYTVEEVANSSWTQSYPASPGTQNVTLVSGVAGPNDVDFGNWRSTGFSGMKFEDLNGNGARDSGEPGLAGWTIKVKQGSTEVASTVTAASGAYSFGDMTPGNYTVEEAVNSSWTQSYPASPGTQNVTLVSGFAGPTDVNFGNWRSTGFSGMKFEDLNGNGARDSGEPGLAGWTIRLMKGSTEVASTVTAVGGAYSFSDIAPGNYTVEEVINGNWTQSYPASPGTQNVTLVSGFAGPTDVNFGNWRSTGFSGMKFEDLNGNGARDSGEPGLAGWTIRLMKGSTEVTSTQTDANGAYSFSSIAPGNYTVEEVVNSSWTQSYPASPGTQNVTLVSGVAGPTDVDFGNWRSTGFSGMKFEDLDRNGTRDSGEPGLAGWTIRLMKGSTEVASTVTSGGGAYSFSGLPPGSYTVEEVISGNWTQSYPASPGTQNATLVSGVAGPTDVDFGNWRSTGFSGMKFEDLNGNGVKDSGEPGLKGWTIRLMQGSTEVASTQTAAGGAYSFSGLPPGSYTVEEIVNSSWTQSFPASGTQNLTLFSGVAGRTDVDFGNWHSTGFSGMKFEDKNGNGAKDSGEPGLAGWTIKVKQGGTEVASTVTDASGAYSFSGLPPGSYTVEEAVNSNWTQSYPASPGTQAVTLVSGVAGRTDVDFGNWHSTGFSGMKFEDKNGNGAKDSGEPGLAGWTIKVKQGGTEVASTVTAASGAYSFSGLPPGSYTVEEAVNSSWTQSYPDTGTQNVNLTSGVAGPTDVNFGNWRTSGFSGMKFEDLNGNGVKDSGEPGLAGWNITLKQGVTKNTTQTDANGAYSFSGIAPGNYTVEEEGKGGWTQSYPASPGIQSVTLVSGEAGRTDVDFGNWRATRFSGVKFEDVNGNGARDSSELGLAGWTIRLMKGGTEINSTQTAAGGAYSFAGIAPGIYTVEEELNSSWKQTSPAGDVYTAVCSSGQTAITKADLSAVAATEVNFGNRKLVEAFSVNITASRQTVQPGQDLVFNITITRLGDIVLTSLGTEYTLPKGLEFVSSIPNPQSIIENADGTTTLIWTDLAFSSLMASQMAESQAVQSSSPSTTLTVNTLVQPGAPEILTGTVAVTGSASEVAIAEVKANVTVEVQSLPLHPISLNKTSDLKEVWPGATVGYTITYESLVNISLTNVTITEQASSDLIFLSATPAPDAGTENVWSIGKLPDHGKGTIKVLFLVKNDSNLSFDSQSSVSGSGFVNSYRRLSTETQSGGLKNSVTLTCDQFTPVSTSYYVKLRDSEGTSLLKKEHGSGEYRSEEESALQMKNRSIRSEGSLKAVYQPTSFSLPGDRAIHYDSEISSLTQTRNRATKASTSQEFRYARSLEMEQQLLLDKNETTMSIEAKVQGQAHLGMLKKDGVAVKPLPVFESSQDYAGTYRINQSLQDYGSNVRMIRNATGLGQAASDQRLKKSQRSFEHGSGSYQSEEQVSTAESYIGKDLVVNYDPQYGYGKWKAGIWSKSSGTSFLGQEITGADYIREETSASGLNDMSTNLSFQGKARLRAVSKSAQSELDLDDEYVGEYSLQRRVHLGGVSRFDRPHLTLNKTGLLVPGTAAADYIITVLNDGNTALGPVYVWDIFPAGTDYLGSSLKPAALARGYANWSLLYLGIGQTVNISLHLNVTDPGEELVNVVYASGGHNGEWVTAGNMSVMQFGWLGCCQPKMLVEKQAMIDAVDSRIIWYRILLKNQANVSLVAQVTDRLPAGLRLLNASVEPQVEGLDQVWVTTAIPAGESRFIEYRVQAIQNGKFVNTARVEAHALDGSGGTSSAASATVTVGEATSYAEDGWRPPEWGLDRMEMICDDTIAGEGTSCSCPV